MDAAEVLAFNVAVERVFCHPVMSSNHGWFDQAERPVAAPF
jgi:hypothetical protein